MEENVKNGSEQRRFVSDVPALEARGIHLE